MADAVLHHGVQHVRAYGGRGQRKGRAGHDLGDRGVIGQGGGHHLGHEIAVGDDALKRAVPRDAERRNPVLAHHLRGMAGGVAGGDRDRIMRHQRIDPAGGEIGLLRLAAAARAVKEPFGRGMGFDQGVELRGGQHQKDGMRIGAGAGDGGTVAHQTALAKGIAQAQMGHNDAVFV